MTARKKPVPKPTLADYVAVNRLLSSPCHHDLCIALNHHATEWHSGGEECKVLVKVRKAWHRIVMAYKPRRRAKAGKGTPRRG